MNSGLCSFVSKQKNKKKIWIVHAVRALQSPDLAAARVSVRREQVIGAASVSRGPSK
jgi:hypothetical protein